MDRRTFLKTGVVALAGVPSLGSTMWRALASHQMPVPGAGPYGPLGATDANGLRLPAGFTSRVLARGGQIVPGTSYRWHFAPDGAATFATGDGGWIYVSNSEVISRGGGAGALRFAADASVADAYRILEQTSFNCAGGPTPWGTWLSCEEVPGGWVWECDPRGEVLAIPRPAMGTFTHEAAAVDPHAPHRVYMTEDRSDGRLYRFTPGARLEQPVGPPLPNPILQQGLLEVARVEPDGAVTWIEVPQPNPLIVGETVEENPTRHQVPDSTVFRGGEGAWFDAVARTVYFTTKGDNSVWAYDVDAETIELLFTSAGNPSSPLNGVDNIVMSPGGEIFLCEDHSASSGPQQIILVDLDGGTVSPIVEIGGLGHESSEFTGPAFDPSGTRLYFSSQRGFGSGVTFEVTGPFRTART